MSANSIAAKLLDIQAVKFSLSPPFTWSSGWKSPIYCDNRLTLSYPDLRNEIKEEFAAYIKRNLPQAEAIAGVATGAIAHGILVADALDLPFIYIRPQPKSHGLQNQIEGKVFQEGKYVVIEDLISTGKSSANAVKALQAAHGQVLITLSIFTYGFAQAHQEFLETGTSFHSLLDLETLMAAASSRAYLSPVQAESVRDWQKKPESWGN